MFDVHSYNGIAQGKEQVNIVGAAASALLDDLRDGDAEVFPGVLLLDGHVGDEFADVVDAESFPDLVDGQADVAGSERGVSGVDARCGELHGIGGAVEVEPRAGGGTVLMILHAEERHRLGAAEAVVDDDVGGHGAGGQSVHGDGLRADGIGGGDVGGAAGGGERGGVDLDGLGDLHQRGAERHGPA